MTRGILVSGAECCGVPSERSSMQAPSLSLMPAQPILARCQAQLDMTQLVATPHRWPSQQELWAALLAYASSGTPGVTCGTNAGTFTFSDACAAITCKLSSSTGYDTTSCDTISVAITTAIFTLGCASGYTYRGTPSLHAAPMQALSPN